MRSKLVEVALNAVKTASTGRTVLLPGDDDADYERHVQAFADEYAPVGPRESDLVQSIAEIQQHLAPIQAHEAAPGQSETIARAA